MEPISRIKKIDWIKIYLRSFYIQATWNYETMQALGFTATLAPVLKRIAGGKEERAAFLQRHLQFFNAHPYFASYILGAVIRLEEMEETDTGDAVQRLKCGLYGPLGSLGDQLFWSGLRPMAAVIGVIFALQGSIWGCLFFLCLYNGPHLWIRYWGLKQSYALGEDVSKALISPLFKRAIGGIQALGAFAVGLFLSTRAAALSRVHINHLIFFLLCIILCWVAYRRRFSLYALCVVAVTLGFGAALMFNG